MLLMTLVVSSDNTGIVVTLLARIVFSQLKLKLKVKSN